MEIRENEQVCIFAPLSPSMDAYESARILRDIQNESRNVAIDLSYVQDCTIDFVETLRKIAKTKKIGVFNIPSDIFVLFNVMHLDKCVKLFVSELDFDEDLRQLINRNLRLV